MRKKRKEPGTIQTQYSVTLFQRSFMEGTQEGNARENIQTFTLLCSCYAMCYNLSKDEPLLLYRSPCDLSPYVTTIPQCWPKPWFDDLLTTWQLKKTSLVPVILCHSCPVNPVEGRITSSWSGPQEECVRLTNEQSDTVKSMYCKELVLRGDTEFSFEELRAQRYFKKLNGMSQRHLD